MILDHKKIFEIDPIHFLLKFLGLLSPLVHEIWASYYFADNVSQVRLLLNLKKLIADFR